VLAVVALRVGWGVAGTRYARFTQFMHAPAATRYYRQQLLAHQEPRHIGHNLLGGWMIIALLLTITGVCVSGWLYTTDRFWGEAWAEQGHEGLTYLLIGLMALHIGGVIFSSLRHGENLIVAMLHGRKRAPGPADIA
jgi:cytochrome b